MRKVSITTQANWQAFVADCDPALASWEPRTSARYPGQVVVCFLHERAWQAAKEFGGFLTVPAPWISIKKLPDDVRAALGEPDVDAATIGDYLQTLLGRDIFRD